MSIMEVGGKKVRGRFPSAGLDTTTRDSTQKSAKEKKKSSIRRTNVETLLTFCGRDIIFLFLVKRAAHGQIVESRLYIWEYEGRDFFKNGSRQRKCGPLPPIFFFLPPSDV